MAKKGKKRIIARLPEETRDEIDRLLRTGHSAEEIFLYLKEQGVQVSQRTVQNYKADWKATERRIMAAEIAAKAMLDKLEQNPSFNVAGALVKALQAQMAEQILDPSFNLDLVDCDPLELIRVLQVNSRTENDLEKLKSQLRHEQEERDRKAADELSNLQEKGDISPEAEDKIRNIYGLQPIHTSN